jgi:hypothetical protein
LDTASWAADRPWLLAVAAGLFIAWVAARNLIAAWRHRHHAADAPLVTIAPPPEVDEHAALWANLAGILTPSRRRRLLYGSPHVALQYTWTGRELFISLWVSGTVPNGAVEAAVRAAWPGAATTTIDTPPGPIPADTAAAVGGHLLPVAAEWVPLHTDHDADPLRALMAAGSQLHDGEHACVQILARPAAPRRAGRARRAAGRLRQGKTALPTVNVAAPLTELIEVFLPGHARSRTGSTPAARRDPSVERDVRAILDKTSHQLWETGVRYAVSSRGHRDGTLPYHRLRGVADAIASSFAVYAGRNRLAHRTRMPRPVAELAQLVPDVGEYGCRVSRPGQRPADDDVRRTRPDSGRRMRRASMVGRGLADQLSPQHHPWRDDQHVRADLGPQHRRVLRRCDHSVTTSVLGQPRQADDLRLSRGAHPDVGEVGVGEAGDDRQRDHTQPRKDGGGTHSRLHDPGPAHAVHRHHGRAEPAGCPDGTRDRCRDLEQLEIEEDILAFGGKPARQHRPGDGQQFQTDLVRLAGFTQPVNDRLRVVNRVEIEGDNDTASHVHAHDPASRPASKIGDRRAGQCDGGPPKKPLAGTCMTRPVQWVQHGRTRVGPTIPLNWAIYRPRSHAV